MKSSAEDAILVLSQCKENSSTPRMVFANDPITLHASLANGTAYSLAPALKRTSKYIQLTGRLLAFVDEQELLPGTSDLSRLALFDEVVSIVWPDRSRLTILREKDKEQS